MRIFITGGSGQVAHDLAHKACEFHQVFAPSRAEVDIVQWGNILQAIADFKPDVVINTAAYTKVDLAETEKDLANLVNCIGAKNVATACAQMKIPLIHLSTDYIFSGEQTVPYRENDVAAPINIYGATKWQGEQAIREICPQSIILRVSAVFGIAGANFVKTILKLAQQKKELRVVADEYTCPTSAYSIATVILQLCQQIKPKWGWGTYHFCGEKAVSWFEFANEIVRIAKKIQPLAIENLMAIPAREYWVPRTSRGTTADAATAKRPAYSVLSCQKIKDVFSVNQPKWEEDLEDVITQLSTA